MRACGWITILVLTILTSVTVLADEVTVVVPKEPGPPLAEAAEDLKTYLDKATGIDATIMDVAPDAKARRILLGSDAWGVTEADLPPKDAGVEAFRIRKRGDAIVIAGRCPVATANGVYTFIQKYLGVRWFTPGSIGEYLPKGVLPEVLEQVSDEVVSPVFAPRNWGWFWDPRNENMPIEWLEWMHRNRMRSPARSPHAHVDSFNAWMSRLWATPGVKEREEFFPLVDGKRRVVRDLSKLPPGIHRSFYWTYCWSNPDFIEIVAQNCRDYFKEHPDAGSVSVGLDDVDIYCQCDACCKLDAGVRPSFSGDSSIVSNRFYWFVNQVASRLAKTHPDKLIRTIIYKNTLPVPAAVEKLEPNIVGIIASRAMVAEWRVPGLREEFISESKAWAKLCSRLGRYQYMGTAELVPRYYPHFLADSLTVDAAHGVTVVYSPATVLLTNVAPMLWAAQQLYWEPGLDVDLLLDAFFTGFFGESAEPMKAYFDTMEELWARPGRGRFSGYSGIRSTAQYMTEEHVERAEGLLAKAREQATDDRTSRKVDIVARAFEFGALITRTYARASAAERLTVTDASTAAGALVQTVKASEFCRTRDERWQEITDADDLTGQSIRKLAAMGTTISYHHLHELDQPIDDAFVRCVLYLARNAPAGLADAARKAAAPHENARLANVAMLIADAQQPAALAEDADFWKDALGYEVDLSEEVTDRLQIADMDDSSGLTTLLDWGKPGETTITLKDFPAFDTKDDQAALSVKPTAMDAKPATAIVTIPATMPMAWQWPALTLTDLAITDWTDFAGLAVGIHNPTQESEEVGLCIRDKDKSSWEVQTRLAPGAFKILSVPMDDIAGKISVKDVLAFTIWTRRPQQQQTFHLTQISLVEATRCRSVDLIGRKCSNGGFEKGSLDGWRADTKAPARVDVTSEDAFEGKCAARIQNAGGEGVYGQLVFHFPERELDKNRTYKLSFAAKPLSGRCRLDVAGGPAPPHGRVVKWLHRKPEWTRYAFSLGYVHPDGQGVGKGTDLPVDWSGWRHLSIIFYGERHYDLLIDDVKLEAN